MSYELYKILHLFGVVMLFTALGGQVFWVLQGGTKETTASRSLLASMHGVGLLLLLVAGFGMHAKLGIDGFPIWFLAKMLLWLVMGAFLALPWRFPQHAKVLWLALPFCGLLAAWLAIAKPGM